MKAAVFRGVVAAGGSVSWNHPSPYPGKWRMQDSPIVRWMLLGARRAYENRHLSGSQSGPSLPAAEANACVRRLTRNPAPFSVWVTWRLMHRSPGCLAGKTELPFMEPPHTCIPALSSFYDGRPDRPHLQSSAASAAVVPTPASATSHASLAMGPQGMHDPSSFLRLKCVNGDILSTS